MTRLLLLAALLAPAWAQDPPPETAEAPAPAGPVTRDVRHEVALRSGTLLVGRIEPADWRIQTAFGMLVVPVDEIKNVKFGRKSDPERLARVAELIKDLASANPERRNHARAALKEEGAFAVRDLVAASKSHEDPEVKRICKELVDELAVPAESIAQDDDRIETTQFALTGTVTPSQFKVTVPELGGLNVMRRDIVHVRLYKAIRSVEAKVSGSHVWPNQWLDTGIKIRQGEKLRITAEGNIHFPNWGGQVFTPDGNFRMGQINGIPVGALAGRVSKSGTVFRIGTSYSGKATNTGTLELCVMMNVRGQPSSGEYTVRIFRDQE
jgi:hypothetical protein